MKAVLLAGGLGTRMREETEFKPKPMVEIGGKPVLWHIMKNLSHHDVNDFIIATGYKSEVIKDYFLNYESRNNDFTVKLDAGHQTTFYGQHDESSWTVTVAFTGENTQTGGRVKRVQQYVGQERFLCTYGDGLSSIDINKLLEFHKSHGRLATVTCVQPTSRFGVLDIADDGTVLHFREKPKVHDWVSVGYFIFEPEIFNYLDEDCTLEDVPLARLAEERQIVAFHHDGFWQPMDTYREYQALNKAWDDDDAPWKTW
ncbi:MAG: glucose-1-phosphate cytidylyltransferase [Actinobacteria bacterium]|uniref:Unannotated protein n=1 Tax=freshwater metagenome TaxID=449393 RepID=A0A6J5YM09_9ZZZZ|nr:glucose-1-phosphate cytidylyltransferase [Actinomycetota bacterium]